MKLCRFAFFVMVCWVPASFAAEPTLVYLVRHAEKLNGTPESPLSEAGQRRVAVLRKFFEKVPIDAVYSSQYRRTRDTVAPIAQDHGLDVETVDAHDYQALREKIHAGQGSTILIGGHSNTVPELIQRLGGPSLTIDEKEYSNLFLLILDGDGVRFQHFHLDP